MGIYNDLNNMGLIVDLRFFKSTPKTESKKGSEIFQAEIKHNNNIITLQADVPYPKTTEQVAKALDSAYLYSVHEIVHNVSSMHFFADNNIFYTPYAIFKCHRGWKDDDQARALVSRLSYYIRMYGIDETAANELDKLGAKKLIDFSEHYDNKMHTSLYNKLLNYGAVQVGKVLYSGVEGRDHEDIYNISSTLVSDGVKYLFELRHYTPYPGEGITEEEVFHNIKLVNVHIPPEKMKELDPNSTINHEQVFTASNDILIIGNTVFIHQGGWFDSLSLDSIVYKDVRDSLSHIFTIFGVTPKLVKQAEALGFLKLI